MTTTIDKLLAELDKRHRDTGRRRVLIVERIGRDSVRVTVASTVIYDEVAVADGDDAEDASARLLSTTEDEED
jgi:chromosome condensin MukBEF MukE localization factor